MIAATLVTLTLRALLASAEPEHAAPHAATPVEHPGAVPAAGGHEAAAGHAAPHGGGHHDTNLGTVMMHHVADGYVIEHPGYCASPEAEEPADRPGKLRWNCEWDLRHTFGQALQLGGTAASCGPADGEGYGECWDAAHLAAKLDLTPTKHVIMMWLASALLLLAVFGALRKKALVPSGFYNFIELLVHFVRKDIVVPNIGAQHAGRFLPYLLTAFFFILFVNLFGLLPFSATATANISVTVVLAVFTFLVTQYAALKAQGVKGYLAHLTGGVPVSLAWLWPIMIPVEFLGLFTKPFALTVRLFANMVAGHFVILALLGLIFAISVFVAPVSVALALAIFMLELFVAFVQAYIFTMLSALFIGAGLVHHAHDDGHDHDHEAEHDHHAAHVAGASPGHW
jgi:F-type H+-transporting ATPase subunit a